MIQCQVSREDFVNSFGRDNDVGKTRAQSSVQKTFEDNKLVCSSRSASKTFLGCATSFILTRRMRRIQQIHGGFEKRLWCTGF